MQLHAGDERRVDRAELDELDLLFGCVATPAKATCRTSSRSIRSSTCSGVAAPSSSSSTSDRSRFCSRRRVDVATCAASPHAARHPSRDQALGEPGGVRTGVGPRRSRPVTASSSGRPQSRQLRRRGGRLVAARREVRVAGRPELVERRLHLADGPQAVVGGGPRGDDLPAILPELPMARPERRQPDRALEDVEDQVAEPADGGVPPSPVGSGRRTPRRSRAAG